MIKNIFFDLDGTLSDSSEGVLRSFNYALDKMGGNLITKNEVGKYIGPKLTDSFKFLLNLKSEEEALKAVDFFREDYVVTGYKINKLYPGIKELLTELKKNNYRLFVATSKREDVATNIINFFKLTHYFKKIYGGGTTKTKEELLNLILSENSLKPDECVMIGDTDFDFQAAKSNNILSIGVTWGYGSENELKNADFIVSNPEEILKWLKNH